VSKAGLVIGGGIAGVQAALDLADQGFTVYLVEKNPSIGGRMAQLDKTFPTLDCAACIMTPKMVNAGRHKNIKLLTFSQIESISRKGKSFQVKILQKPRYVDETRCVGCGVCAEFCPVEVPNEFDEKIGIRSAIYAPFPQAVPLIYTIDKENCLECDLCKNLCKVNAIDYDQQPQEIEIEVGAIIVATGFNLFDSSRKEEYAYGTYDNVITGLALERLLSVSGPTGGYVIRPSDGKIPKRIAFIQDIGSRGDQKIGDAYWSGVLCMYATKEAELVKAHIPDADVRIYSADIERFSKEFGEFYRRAKEEFKVNFSKKRVTQIIENPETKNLLIKIENGGSGEPIEEEVDMVVLLGSLAPAATKDSEGILSIKMGEEEVSVKPSPKVDPVTTSVKGVFTAGVAECPRNILDAVMQASTAARKASVFLEE
jgi:heterodisulfide reductase subunit A